MPGYPFFVALHVTAGVLALVTFWVNGAMRKGGATHRRVGQVYAGAMVAVLVSGVPLVVQRLADGRVVGAAFLAYLLLITATATWTMWRAVRDRQAPGRFTGPMYRAIALANLIAGVGVLALGLRVGQPLLIGFSIVGLFTGYDMLRRRATLAQVPGWWRERHYAAVIGNGIATHISFLAIGLPKLLPQVSGSALYYAAWFGPLVVGLAAKLWLDRHYGPASQRPARTAAAMR